MRTFELLYTHTGAALQGKCNENIIEWAPPTHVFQRPHPRRQ